MAGKHTNEGENRMLNQLYGDESLDTNLYLGLYTDTEEPAEDITLATITELPVANGYARIAIAKGVAAGDWTISDDLATADQKTFTCATANWGNVYGYFICTVASGTSGKILYVEHFSNGPYYIEVGDPVKVTVKIEAQ